MRVSISFSLLTHLKLNLKGARRIEHVVDVLDVLDQGGGGREGVRLALQQQIHCRVLRCAQAPGTFRARDSIPSI